MDQSKSQNYDTALAQATPEEKMYISNPTRKNYTWLIVLVTVAIIAGSAWYFYKH